MDGSDADIESDADVSAQRFRALYENTTDAIAEVRLVDGQFIVQDVNPAFEEVFGYEAAEIVGEDIDEFVLPDDGSHESIGDAMEQKEQVTREVRRRTADGIKDFHARTVPLEVGGGWTQGFVIYTDISERKAKERRLERFAGVISHDLRNPLQVAQGNLRAAIERADDPDDTLESALDAVTEMGDLLEGLVTLTRAEDAGVDATAVDLAAAAERAWDRVDARDATLVTDGSERLLADERALGQLLVNLLGNAVDHGGPSVTVRVGPLADGAGFYVADDGPGIPAGERERVFEEGYTTAEDGLGLGLQVVRQLAEAHGWTVSATASESGGARFEVTGVDRPG